MVRTIGFQPLILVLGDVPLPEDYQERVVQLFRVPSPSLLSRLAPDLVLADPHLFGAEQLRSIPHPRAVTYDEALDLEGLLRDSVPREQGGTSPELAGSNLHLEHHGPSYARVYCLSPSHTALLLLDSGSPAAAVYCQGVADGLYARYSGACCWHPGQLLEGISGCLEQDSPEVRAWYGIWDVSRGYLTYADAGIGLVGGQKGSPLIASQDTYPEQVLDFVGQETAVFAEGATSSKLEDIMTDLERDVSRDVLIVHPRPPCQSLSAGDIETVMTSLEEPNLDLRYSVRALCETIVAHSPRAWIRWWSGEDRFDISVVLPPEAVPWSLSPLDRRLEWQQDLRLLFDEVEVSPDGHELSARYLLD